MYARAILIALLPLASVLTGCLGEDDTQGDIARGPGDGRETSDGRDRENETGMRENETQPGNGTAPGNETGAGNATGNESGNATGNETAPGNGTGPNTTANETTENVTLEIVATGVFPLESTYDRDYLEAPAGALVTLGFWNQDPYPFVVHTWVLEGVDGAETEELEPGDSTSIVFYAPATPGDYAFYCRVDDHRERGMEGTFRVTETNATT
ncbi:MAG: cupredoxin domain-containing protein [Methanobacteriota archaeon]